MIHQSKFVDGWMALKVTHNVAILVVRSDKAGRMRSLEIERDSQEWRNILVMEPGPNEDLPEDSEPLLNDEI